MKNKNPFEYCVANYIIIDRAPVCDTRLVRFYLFVHLMVDSPCPFIAWKPIRCCQLQFQELNLWIHLANLSVSVVNNTIQSINNNDNIRVSFWVGLRSEPVFFGGMIILYKLGIKDIKLTSIKIYAIDTLFATKSRLNSFCINYYYCFRICYDKIERKAVLISLNGALYKTFTGLMMKKESFQSHLLSMRLKLDRKKEKAIVNKCEYLGRLIQSVEIIFGLLVYNSMDLSKFKCSNEVK